MTYYEVLQQGIGQLEETQIENAKGDAWMLLAHVCKISREYYYLHMRDEIEASMEVQYFSFIEKRKSHVPLQHLTGEQDFMGLTFKVTPDVLIPRYDTEILVEKALTLCPKGARVLDLCTGSGCIIISMARLGQDITAYAGDISKAALEVAGENARMHDVQVTFEKSDLYEQFSEKYDMIISNPPYIRTEVIDTLMPEVRDYEPHLALDGEADGLVFYRRIVDGSVSHLNAGGILIMEIGHDQGADVSDMLQCRGYHDVQVIKDLAGLDRVVLGIM